MHADHHEKGDTKPATRADYLRYAKAMQGMWKGEVKSVIGDSSLGRTGDAYTAYWSSDRKSSNYAITSFSGGKKSHNGLTFFDANLKKIVSISTSNDGTVTRSYLVPKGDSWYRETTHTKADGKVSREELIAVKDKLKIPDHELDQVGKIFNKAKEESTGYEPYAKQIAQIYKGNINVLEEVINILFYIAEADGDVSPSELAMIENISKIFGLTEVQFNSVRESRKGSDKLNPYIVLESNPDDDLQSIRKKYLKLSKENHPDLLISKGVPQEVIDESKNKMRAINSAWDQIQKLKSN